MDAHHAESLNLSQRLAQYMEQARAIAIAAHHRSADLLPGQYLSLFKGRGIEYENSREYTMGDDPKHIDWKLTARRGAKKEDGTYHHPYIKEFCEEREFTVLLAVDISGSIRYCGSETKTKLEVAAEICGLLAASAVHNNDRVGLILFSQTPELCLRPRKGIEQVIKILYSVLSHSPRSCHTDLQALFRFLVSQYHQRCLVFLISDFLTEDFSPHLTVAARRHEIVAFHIITDQEQAMPQIGLAYLRDAETGQETLVDTSSHRFQKQYAQQAAKRNDRLSRTFFQAQVPEIKMYPQEPVLQTIMRNYHP